jgi:hypothetical protein
MLRSFLAPLAFAATLVVGLSSCTVSIDSPEDEGLAVLFIGNSLTQHNSLPSLVEKLLVEAGVDARVESACIGGFGLQDHWVMGPARSYLDRGGWDVVVLQQGPSATEGRPSLLEYSEKFAEEIRFVGARPALYMVWPSERRFFDFDGVSDSYRTAADLVDGLIFPAGEAWRAAWRLRPNAALYSLDGLHPTEAGTYLAALVMVQQLADLDPTELPTEAGGVGLSPDLVRVLQQAAAEANAEFARK